MISYEFHCFLNDKARELLIPLGFKSIGNKLNGRCPICGDSKKTQSKKRGFYYYDTSTYYCFNCGASLSGTKFITAMTGQDYQEIRKEYAKYYLDQKKNGTFTKENDIYQVKQSSNQSCIFNFKSEVKQEWKNELSDSAREYLDKRLVTKSPFYKYNSFYSCYTKSTNREYILIPWVVNGVDAYYQLNDFHKYNPNMKYIFPKSLKKLVYGLDNIDTSWPYIIVFEGVYDSLFVKNGVAVGTKSISESQLDMITKRYPKHKIVIAFDNDKSGLEASIKYIKRQENFYFFKWFNTDTTEKDINEYIINHGDVNIFSDKSKLETMIISKFEMKLFLTKNRIWKNDSRSKPKQKGEILKRQNREIYSDIPE